ncbi:MAG: hypothetical protein ACHQ7M_16210 [Chloroflexota bacterium]
MPTHLIFLRWFFASCIILGPVVAFLYGLLNPTPLHVTNGAAAIALNVAADPLANQLHLVFGVVLSFLLPLWYLGMAWLALRRAPWLATIAGLLSLVGWIPWSALIGQEALTATMAQMGGGTQLAALWARYNGSGVLTAYLLIYIVGHLLSAVLLAIALGRSRLVPIWAAWALALTSPLQIIAILVHQLAVGLVVAMLWFGSSLPIARALLRGDDDLAPRPLVARLERRA